MSSTPGPWTFVPWHIEEGPPAVRAPEGWIVCTASSDDDARLIAASPDMAEARLEAIKFADQDCMALTPAGDAMIARWRAALAKAGVTPPGGGCDE